MPGGVTTLATLSLGNVWILGGILKAENCLDTSSTFMVSFWKSWVQREGVRAMFLQETPPTPKGLIVDPTGQPPSGRTHSRSSFSGKEDELWPGRDRPPGWRLGVTKAVQLAQTLDNLASARHWHGFLSLPSVNPTGHDHSPT